MAGVYIQVDDTAVLDRLQRLAAAIGNVDPALKDIGEYLAIAHDERFEAQRGPDGAPWAPLADETVLARMRRGVRRGKGEKTKRLVGKGGSTQAGAVLVLARLKILRDSGELQDSLRYQIGGSVLLFGTDRKYGATQQFGDPDRHIPARPFLGVSATDRAQIGDILGRHLAQATA